MRIHLNEMVFYGHHGVHPEERKLGQRFIVDFTYETDPNLDQKIKHINDTVNYTKVFGIIKDIIETREFFLLEDCANIILNSVMEDFPKIEKSIINIKKPSVPIKGSINSVEIEMERIR